MDKKVYIILFLLLVGGLFIIACCPPNCPTTPSSSSTCPPIGRVVKATISPADSSSIEVDTNTYAQYDGGTTYWCNPDELRINPVPASTASACKILHANCLAEVDLKPDNVKIISPSGKISTPPVLSYDFSAHATPTRHPEECQKIFCYAFYRLNPTNTWVWAGSAEAVNISSKWYARGTINHLSLFALVELPPPQPVARPRNLSMIVASDFLSDDAGGMLVALQVVSDDQNQLVPADEILFHFNPVDTSQSIGNPPKECQDGRSIPDFFSCLFPIGSSVIVILDVNGTPNLHEIKLFDKSYGQDFYASTVEMYY